MHWHLLTVVLLVAAPPHQEKKDEEKIQGNWTVVSREFIGKKTPEAELKALKVIIKNGTITMDDGKKKEKIRYKLDPSKKPKAIDLANTGIESKETTLAIYELDGDTLKICWSEKDPEHRATKFASDEDSGQTVIVFKREKKPAEKKDEDGENLDFNCIDAPASFLRVRLGNRHQALVDPCAGLVRHANEPANCSVRKEKAKTG
jgi:uncharacterized protein (TIGR03067 family)